MSRRSDLNRHRSFRLPNAMDERSENRLQEVKGAMSQIRDMLKNRPDEWENYLPTARSAIATLEEIHFCRPTDRLSDQIWCIQRLQDFAYHNSDEGHIQDIADWCQSAWLKVLRVHTDDVQVLTGLGHHWLQRSQSILARIHREEGSGSSSGDSGCSSIEGSAVVLGGNSTERNISARSTKSKGTADLHVQDPLYVEARGYLQPAVDFFSRAVTAADLKGELTGDLLECAAEAYMSLGNVSSQLVGQQHFTQAIRYLRRAHEMHDYTLSGYLQQYLDDYGRYIS